MYPEIRINTSRLLHNVKVMVNLCNQYNVKITGITKMFGADVNLAQIYLDGGIHVLGDSRIENLSKLTKLEAEKWLIRIPMLSEAAVIVKSADVSLNSELCTLQALDAAAKQQKKIHKVILMVDLGDIREGFFNQELLLQTAKAVKKMNYLQLYGIGTNLTCFSFVHPDSEKLLQLQKLGSMIDGGLQELIVSGGNSATIELMMNRGLPKGINNLRLGESLLFGRERASYRYIEDTYSDVFVLRAEIVELKEKPSLPWGKVGVDSYGRRPIFEDRGLRIKAICAVGRLDIDIETMRPLDPGIQILGASSDHLMLDITDSEFSYKIGDLVEFVMGYFSTMRAFASRSVAKVYQ